MKNITSQKLSAFTKIGYSLGEMEKGPYNMFYMFFIMFLTNVVQLNPYAVAFIVFLAIVWDGITNPLIGTWCDNSMNPNGRRRPYMIRSIIPFVIVTLLLWVVPPLSMPFQILYYIVFACLYWTANTYWHVGFISLGAEMVKDYDDKTSLSSYRTFIIFTSNAAVSYFTFILITYFIEQDGNVQGAWFKTAALYTMLAALGFFISWVATKGKEPKNINLQDGFRKESVKHRYREALKLKPFRNLIFTWAFFMFGCSMSGGAVVYYLMYYLRYDAITLSTFLLFATLGALWVPVINMIAKKLEKKTTLLIFLIGGCMVNGLGLWFVLTPETPHWIAFGFAFLFAAGNAAMWNLLWSMCFDVFEVDEIKTGHRREGLYSGLISFFQKGSTAIAVAGVALFLGAFGFDAAAPVQSETAILGIRLASAAVPFFSFLVCVLVMLPYRLDRKTHHAIMDALALKAEGKDYSTTEFDHLLK